MYCPSGSHAEVNSHSSPDQPLPAHPSFHLRVKAEASEGHRPCTAGCLFRLLLLCFLFRSAPASLASPDLLAPSQGLCACRSLCQGHPCRRCLPGRTLLNVSPAERPPLRVTSGARFPPRSTAFSALSSSQLLPLLIPIYYVFIKLHNRVSQAALVVKNTPANAGDAGLTLGGGRSPPGRAWSPTAVFLPGESHAHRSLAGCSPQGRTESATTEHQLLKTR